MSIEIDIQQVAGDAARMLGAQFGEATLELVATRAANTRLSARVDELEREAAERDTELAQLRLADELLQRRVREFEAAELERECDALVIDHDEDEKPAAAGGA